jgi:KDO2-lipid IV(A) lauroyltransferase
MFIVRILPKKGVYLLCSGLSGLGYLLLKKRRKITLENLQLAFPEKQEQERVRIAKASYQNLGISFAFNLLIQTNRITNKELESYVTLEDQHTFHDAFKDGTSGTLFITAHIGNWELLPQYIALKQTTPLHVIAREASNPLIEKHLISPLRNRFGFNVFYKKNAVLHMLRALKRGEHAGILIDQKLNDRIHVEVPFFGLPSRCTPVPALLQIRHNIRIQPIFMIHKQNGTFSFLIEKPIEHVNNSASEEEQIRHLTAQHQAAIEKIIRAYPEQWFWMHNRWNLKEKR